RAVPRQRPGSSVAFLAVFRPLGGRCGALSGTTLRRNMGKRQASRPKGPAPGSASPGRTIVRERQLSERPLVAGHSGAAKPPVDVGIHPHRTELVRIAPGVHGYAT